MSHQTYDMFMCDRNGCAEQTMVERKTAYLPDSIHIARARGWHIKATYRDAQSVTVYCPDHKIFGDV